MFGVFVAGCFRYLMKMLSVKAIIDRGFGTVEDCSSFLLYVVLKCRDIVWCFVDGCLEIWWNWIAVKSLELSIERNYWQGLG